MRLNVELFFKCITAIEISILEVIYKWRKNNLTEISKSNKGVKICTRTVEKHVSRKRSPPHANHHLVPVKEMFGFSNQKWRLKIEIKNGEKTLHSKSLKTLLQ